MSTIPIIFDDTDLVYTGKWDIGGRPPEYRSTTHGTNQASASASFTFTGTSISVYGTIAANAKPAISTYTVDNSHAAIFTALPIKAVQYKQLFYQVSDLPYGQHNLIITCTTPNTQFWLDFITVGNEAVPTASSIPTTSSIPTPITQQVAESPSKTSTILSTVISTLPSSSFKSIVFLSSSTVNSLADLLTITPSLVSTPTSVPTSSKPKPANSGNIDDARNSTSSVFQDTPSSSLVLPSPSTSSGDYVPPGSTSQVASASSGNRAGAIAGGVIATLVCIALAIVAFLWLRRRRAMRAPSRQAPKTPDPRWFTRHSFQWPTSPNNEKAQTGQYM